MVSYHGRIYFVHPESGRIYRFSLVLGPSSMKQYGNVTISRSGSISFFSAAHYDRNIGEFSGILLSTATNLKANCRVVPV